MVQINFALKEVNCKIVYYGPGLSGKTTNLEVVHGKAPKSHVGELTSIATEGDRTLFFDFLPLSLGKVAGMNTKFQIYTVPGQVYYNSTRKLVLQGADGIAFVADSRRSKVDENLESLQNLEDNLREYGMDITTMPLVLQYNKRDLDDVMSIDELQKALNKYGAPYFEAVAVKGEGVFPTLKKLSSMVLENLNKQHGSAGVKTKQSAPVKEPAMVGAGGGAAPPPRPVAPPKPGRVKPIPPGRGSRRVRENVTRSPGVRPVERKRPVADGRRRPRPVVPPPRRGRPRRSGGGNKVVAAVVFLLLAAAGAAVYFSGIWKKFV